MEEEHKLDEAKEIEKKLKIEGNEVDEDEEDAKGGEKIDVGPQVSLKDQIELDKVIYKYLLSFFLSFFFCKW